MMKENPTCVLAKEDGEYKTTTFVFIIFCCLFYIPQGYSQNLDDYRSVSSGNWTIISVWEIYDGDSWVAASDYPGQKRTAHNVHIRGGNEVSINSAISKEINTVIVGDGLAERDLLKVTNTASLKTSKIIIEAGGDARWTSNVSLHLPEGSAFVIEPGGDLDADKSCNASKRLIIGSNIYASCNGGAGADYSFKDLKKSGGSLAVLPSFEGMLCLGQPLRLLANPVGTGVSTAAITWLGKGPNGFSFSSKEENPLINGLAIGSYTFSVVISDKSGNFHKNEIRLEVPEVPVLDSQPENTKTATGISTFFSLEGASSSLYRYQWQVNSDGGSEFIDVGDGPDYSGSTTPILTIQRPRRDMNLYRYRVIVSKNEAVCGTTASNAAVLTVIENQRATENRDVQPPKDKRQVILPF
ncbi:hypothetical protein FK220_019745 [Flavobacteriaceae bacterium TP-CH-4]|uniref:Ig-like domain-containing protein n=1 Tax=Pelagihabitans pacificus TaxID=2696054 RepID=A0A967AW97_9FLAO|nr:hypothetical protein [Pelagihabitans pacificus]NHF61596.1 hypothetical protein [Pelagihabitans pacificus]